MVVTDRFHCIRMKILELASKVSNKSGIVIEDIRIEMKIWNCSLKYLETTQIVGHEFEVHSDLEIRGAGAETPCCEHTLWSYGVLFYPYGINNGN